MTENVRNRIRYLAIMLSVAGICGAALTVVFLSFLCVYADMPVFAWTQIPGLSGFFIAGLVIATGAWLTFSNAFERLGLM